MAAPVTLARLGKLVAEDVAAGQPRANSQLVYDFLGPQPQAVLDLVEMVGAEAGKKRRNENMITAYAHMIGQALEFARYGIEAGHSDAAELAENVRQRLLALGKGEQIEPPLLLLILSQFATAKLDPGPELRELMEHLATRRARELEESQAVVGLEDHFEELVRAVDGDPFLLYSQISEMSEAFPEDHRAAMASTLLQSSGAPAREAALGWLLDRSASVRNLTASALERAAAVGGVSGVMLRHMITLRNWLPESDRASLDRAIHACRRKPVEITPCPQPQVRYVLASVIDGAGAQSIFVVSREGRRNAIACILLKDAVGIRDAWTHHGMTRSELDEFLNQLEGIELLPVNLNYVRIAVAHALAVQKIPEAMPPFLLLDAMETGGLQNLQPAEVPVERLLDMLTERANPAFSRPELADEILKASRDLPHELEILDSWFEEGAEVDQLLRAKNFTRSKRIELVQNDLLPRHVKKWIKRLSWTALTLQYGEEDEPWQELFISARELNAGRAMNEIPLMMRVAANTVDAFIAGHPRKRC